MTLCNCGHPRDDHRQHDNGVYCYGCMGECTGQEKTAAVATVRLSAGVTPEGLAEETVADDVKVTPPTDEARPDESDYDTTILQGYAAGEARAPEQTVEPRTEAGRTLLERLRDLFASWESLAEYHNIATDELVDPLGFILAIEREAAAVAAPPLDEQRLADALRTYAQIGDWLHEGIGPVTALEVARNLAREYARLLESADDC